MWDFDTESRDDSESMGENLKTCEPDYKAENEALAEKIAHLSDENYNLKMAIAHLTEVMMNGYKDFGF